MYTVASIAPSLSTLFPAMLLSYEVYELFIEPCTFYDFFNTGHTQHLLITQRFLPKILHLSGCGILLLTKQHTEVIGSWQSPQCSQLLCMFYACLYQTLRADTNQK